MSTVAAQLVIAYPREAEVGKRYALTVDLQHEAAGWPSDVGEELAFHCVIDVDDAFSCTSSGDAAILMHRFGGTYGPARFVLEARQAAEAARVRITLLDARGAIVSSRKLDPIEIRERWLWQPTASSHGAEDYAIVIGIADYSGRQLQTPGDDALAFYSWLAWPKGGGLLPQRIDVLTSSNPTVRHEPSSKTIRAALERALDLPPHPTNQRRRRGRRLYVYAAGHGAEHNGVPLLASADLGEREDALFNLRGFLVDALDGGFFDEAVLFMDVDQDASDLKNSRAFRGPTGPTLPQASRCLLGFSTRSRERGDTQVRGGAFTRALLDVLGANHQGGLLASRFRELVYRRVEEVSAAWGQPYPVPSRFELVDDLELIPSSEAGKEQRISETVEGVEGRGIGGHAVEGLTFDNSKTVEGTSADERSVPDDIEPPVWIYNVSGMIGDTFEFVGSPQVAGGDLVMVFISAPRLRPFGIYEVVTERRIATTDELAARASGATARCRRLLALPEPNAEVLANLSRDLQSISNSTSQRDTRSLNIHDRLIRVLSELYDDRDVDDEGLVLSIRRLLAPREQPTLAARAFLAMPLFPVSEPYGLLETALKQYFVGCVGGDPDRDIDEVETSKTPAGWVFRGKWRAHVRFTASVAIDHAGIASLRLIATKRALPAGGLTALAATGPDVGNSVLVARFLHVALFALRAGHVIAARIEPAGVRELGDMGLRDGNYLAFDDLGALTKLFRFIELAYQHPAAGGRLTIATHLELFPDKQLTQREPVRGETDEGLAGVEGPGIGSNLAEDNVVELDAARAQPVVVRLADASGRGRTSETFRISVSKTGRAFEAISPNVTERGNGVYEIHLTSGHTDTPGLLKLRITGLDGVPTEWAFEVRNRSDAAIGSSPSTRNWHGTLGPVPWSTLWSNGSTLKVRFLDGAQTLRKRTREIVREWTQHANIRFEFDDKALDAPIRISFLGSGASALHGRNALAAPRDQATVKLGVATSAPESELRRVVLHEFGEVLGLVNETQSPNAAIDWNADVVYRELMGPPNNWSRNQIERNMFSTYADVPLRVGKEAFGYRPFDAESIMMHAIPPSWTNDGFATPVRSSLSASDATFIRELYPPDVVVVPSPPRMLEPTPRPTFEFEVSLEPRESHRLVILPRTFAPAELSLEVSNGLVGLDIVTARGAILHSLRTSEGFVKVVIPSLAEDCYVRIHALQEWSGRYKLITKKLELVPDPTLSRGRTTSRKPSSTKRRATNLPSKAKPRAKRRTAKKK